MRYITDISVIFGIIRILNHGTDISWIYHRNITIYHFDNIILIYQQSDISVIYRLRKNNFLQIYQSEKWYIRYKWYIRFWFLKLIFREIYQHLEDDISLIYHREISQYITKMIYWRDISLILVYQNITWYIADISPI